MEFCYLMSCLLFKAFNVILGKQNYVVLLYSTIHMLLRTKLDLVAS